MSDEPTPLRLKPRFKPDGAPGAPPAETPPPPPPEPTPAPPAGEGESAPKIRLRPKLSVPAEAQPAAAPTPEPAPETPPETPPPAETPRLKPRLSLPSEPAAPAEPVSETSPAAVPPESPPPAPPPSDPPAGGGDFPKFKLKFKGAAGAAGAAPAAAPSPAAAPLPEAAPVVPEEIPPAPEPSPVSAIEVVPGAPSAGEMLAAKFKPPGPLRLSEDQLPPLDPGEVKLPKPPVPKKALTAGVVGAIAAFLVVFGGSAYFTYRMRQIPPPPPPPKPVVKPLPVVEEAPPPEKEAPEPVEKKAPVGPKVRRPAAVTKAPSTPAASTTNLGGGISATTNDDVTATDASPAFRSWVANAKLSGVYQGTPPRALINGRITTAGQTVDEGLGIIFDRVDAENKMIIFKDGSGAVVSRHY